MFPTQRTTTPSCTEATASTSRQRDHESRQTSAALLPREVATRVLKHLTADKVIAGLEISGPRFVDVTVTDALDPVKADRSRCRHPARHRQHRRAGIIALAIGAAASLAFFAFFPGLPHAIDWSAILVSLVVGALTR